jgi:nicotinate-nucleotide--dimethylbenzimidazole phosphoribosyltransferase
MDTLAELPGAIRDQFSDNMDYYSAHPQQFQNDATKVAGNLLFQAVTAEAMGKLGGGGPEAPTPEGAPVEAPAPAPVEAPPAAPVETVAPVEAPAPAPVEAPAPGATETPTQVSGPPETPPQGVGPSETPTRVGPSETPQPSGPAQPEPGSEAFRNAQTQRIDRFQPGEQIHYNDIPAEPSFSPAEPNPAPSETPTVRLSPEETYGTSPGGTPDTAPTPETNPGGFRGANTEVMPENAPTQVSGPSETPTVDGIDPSQAPTVDGIDPSQAPTVDGVGPSETPTVDQVNPSDTPQPARPAQPEPGSEAFRNAQTQRIDRFQPGERIHYNDIPAEPSFSPAEPNPAPSETPTVRLSPEETYGTSPGGTPGTAPTPETNPGGFRGANTEVMPENAPTVTEPAPNAPANGPAPAEAPGGGSPDQTQILDQPAQQPGAQPPAPDGAAPGTPGGGAPADFGMNPEPPGWDPTTMDTIAPDYEEAMAPDPGVWTEANQPAYQANSAQDVLERVSGTSERFPGDSMTRASEFGNREMLDAAYEHYSSGLDNVARLANADPEYFSKLPDFQAERMQAQLSFDEASGQWHANPTPKSFYEDALNRNLGGSR